MKKFLLLAGLLASWLAPWGAKAQIACTVQTQSVLLNEFSDNVAAGAITPQIMRNFVCSVPSLGTPPVRTVLAAPLTLFVDPGLGTDSPTCGTASAASACKTLQVAVNNAYANYDTRGNNITISLADSTNYAPVNISGALVGNGGLTISGNTGSPANVLMDGASAALCVNVQNYANVAIQGMKIQNCSILAGASQQHAQLTVNNLILGPCVSNGVQLYASRQSYLEVVGTYQISSGTNCTNHMQASHQGNIRAAQAITGSNVAILAANLTYATGGFVSATSGGDITFTGYAATPFNLNTFAVTGTRYIVDTDGLIQTSLALSTFFPGNSAGLLHGVGSYNGGLNSTAASISGFPGGSTITGGSDNYSGQVSEAAGSTGGTVTFGSPFDNIPVCTVATLGAAFQNLIITAIGNTSFVVAHSAAASGFTYSCHGA